MLRERYVILVGCTLLLSAFVVSLISGEMTLYDIIIIGATLTEKGISTNNFQRLIVVLSLFGGISTIFGGITYFFQIRTNRSILEIDNAQFDNYKDILRNQKVMGDTMEAFIEESGYMQRKMMRKIRELENSLSEMRRINKKLE